MYDKMVERLQKYGLTVKQCENAMLAVTCAAHTEKDETWRTLSDAYHLVREIIIDHEKEVAAQSAVEIRCLIPREMSTI